MKTLSVRQPEAWLIVQGIKDVENRTWTTKYRGPLLIHASAKAMTQDDIDYLCDMCDIAGRPYPLEDELPCGGIVGQAVLAEISESSESPWWDGASLAWTLTDAAPLAFVPCKGKLGLWEFSTEG